jgi:hypothetical protein
LFFALLGGLASLVHHYYPRLMGVRKVAQFDGFVENVGIVVVGVVVLVMAAISTVCQ